MGYYYNEFYGYKDSRVFGYWQYDEDNNRMLFESGGCVEPGDSVVVKCRMLTNDSEARLIPVEAYNMMRARVFQWHFSSKNVRKSIEYKKEFKAEISQYKRNKLAEYSIDDYINAFTRGWSSAPR